MRWPEDFSLVGKVLRKWINNSLLFSWGLHCQPRDQVGFLYLIALAEMKPSPHSLVHHHCIFQKMHLKMTNNYVVGFLVPLSSLRDKHTLECERLTRDLMSKMKTFWVANFYRAWKTVTRTKIWQKLLSIKEELQYHAKSIKNADSWLESSLFSSAAKVKLLATMEFFSCQKMSDKMKLWIHWRDWEGMLKYGCRWRYLKKCVTMQAIFTC